MHSSLVALLTIAFTLSGVDAGFGSMSKRQNAPYPPAPPGQPPPGPHGPVDPPGNPCEAPPGGWSWTYQPDPECGNEPLLEWCHAVDPKGVHSLAACWDRDETYWCLTCEHVSPGQLPPNTKIRSGWPKCATRKLRAEFCRDCPDDDLCKKH